MRKTIILLALIFLSILATAQKFAYQANLQRVDSSGYYHIYLSPEITAKLNYKFSDIRLYNKHNKEIPYIRLSEDEMYKTAPKKTLKIIQNIHKRQKRYTQVLINNTEALKISNLVLVAINPQNSEAWVNISASNDRKLWNVLKEHSRYMPEYSDSATAEIRIDDLPETSYKYYRILIYDFNRTIFVIKKVLNYEIKQKNTEYVAVMKPKFIQNDSSETNQTTVQISFKEPQYIDKLVFKISSPSYYLRKAEITKRDSTSGKKIRLKLYDQNQKDFYLCSDSSNVLLLSRYYVQNLFLIVDNNDNQPLKFKDIDAYQRKEYIVAYLKKNMKYHLNFGNRNIPLPIYDLKYFKNKIPVKCPKIGTTKIRKIIQRHRKEKNIQISPLYLWIVFGIVILILIAISVKMFLISRNKNTPNNKDEIH